MEVVSRIVTVWLRELQTRVPTTADTGPRVPVELPPLSDRRSFFRS